MRGSIKNKIEILKSALTELGFKFVEAFQEKGVGLIEKITDAITKFDPQPVIDAVVTAGNAIGGIIKIVYQLRYFILGLAIAWGTYKAAMLVGAAVAPILTLFKAIKMLASGQKLATVAQWAFNAAANANPIGIIITAIGILIGLIILAVKHFQGFLEMLSKIPIIGEKIAPAVEKTEAFRNELKGIDETTTPAEAAPEKVTRPRPQRVRPVLPAALRPSSPADEANADALAAASALPPAATAPAASVNAAPRKLRPLPPLSIRVLGPPPPGR
jgi:hypothetical protein